METLLTPPGRRNAGSHARVTARAFGQMHAPWTVLAAVAATVAVRAPFVGLPLRTDEGGLATIGRAFVDAHGRSNGSMYGGLWLDRPPLLVAIYGGAERLGGSVGVRLLGLAAAVAIVLLASAVARTLAGNRAAAGAAIVAAALMSSPVLDATFAYPELIAAGLVAGATLCCLVGLRAEHALTRRWVLAGVLASCALLTKQSFMDGLAVVLVAGIVGSRGFGMRRTLGPALLGAAAPLVATLAWAVTIGPGVRALVYAMWGFRIQGANALRSSPVHESSRFHRLGITSMDAALPILVPIALLVIVGLARRRQQRAVALVLATWLAWGLVGVLGGGYYWGHYMIQLAPVLAVSTGMWAAARRRTWIGVSLVTVVVVCVSLQGARGVIDGRVGLHQRSGATVAAAIRHNRHPDDSLLVLYAHANVAYLAGIRPTFPYQWSLMYTAVPGAQDQLDAYLASEGRPTWLVRWQQANGFGLDADHRTRQLIDANYRVAARPDGRELLLRRDDHRVVTGI